jgi:hypothetical protein
MEHSSFHSSEKGTNNVEAPLFPVWIGRIDDAGKATKNSRERVIVAISVYTSCVPSIRVLGVNERPECALSIRNLPSSCHGS